MQSLIALRKYISIEKHQAGSILLKFSMKVLSDATAMDIIKQAKNEKMPTAVKKSSLNLISRTIQIDYDASIINPEEFTDILTTTSRERFNTLVQKYESILTA